MPVESFLILCAQAFFIQAISAQCIGPIDGYSIGTPWNAAPLPAVSCSTSYAAPIVDWAYAPTSNLAASNGPGLSISSASPRIPAGVSVISENAYEGALAVGGALPFLGTTAFTGALTTIGAGAVAYDCGNRAVTITAEDMDAYRFAGLPDALGHGFAVPAIYGSGIGYGPCGYSAIY